MNGPTLFSYVVDHDYGFAPNPYDDMCTLVHCKFGGWDRRRNIVELVERGDWILGSGGSSRESAGNGRIIYLMRVDEILPFAKFLADHRFQGREDHLDLGNGNVRALVSHHYFYFGRNAIPITDLPRGIPIERLLKKGPNFRRDLPTSVVNRLTEWFERTFHVGMHGDPCAGRQEGIAIRRRRSFRCLPNPCRR